LSIQKEELQMGLFFHAKKIGTGCFRFPFTKEKAFEKLPA
jgi:hypothetical protein